MKTKTKEKTLSTLIKELDTVFSLFIRARDADNSGTVTCFVSKERVWWRDADAAHFVGRSKMPTRYNEMNVHACSKESNQYDPDHHTKYYKRMDEFYGWRIRQDLEALGNSLQKFTRPELEEMIIEYTEKTKEIRKSKGF